MKKIIALIFLVTLFLISACKSNEPTNPADQILDNNIFNEAVADNNLERCDDILSEDLKKECKQTINARSITDEAIKNLDKSKCAKIELERYEENCKNSVQNVVDKEEKKLKAKEEAEKSQNEMASIESKAINENDADICNSIKDKQVVYACRYNVLANLAIQKNKLSLCDEIGEKSYIEKCKSNISPDTNPPPVN